MAFLDLAKLSHRTMNAIEPCFQQQAQGTGPAAFLESVASTVQPGDVPLQAGLLLFQPSACALLNC